MSMLERPLSQPLNHTPSSSSGYSTPNRNHQVYKNVTLGLDHGHLNGSGRHHQATIKLARRRNIDLIVRNILSAMKNAQRTEVALIYYLTCQLDSILQLQRRYLNTNESTFLDEIVSVPLVLKILDTVVNPEFVGWQIDVTSYNNLLCREQHLRTVISALRLLRLHGVRSLNGELADHLMQKVHALAEPSENKQAEDMNNGLCNWNIEYLLTYLCIFLRILPECRTSAQDLAKNVLCSVPVVTQFQASQFFARLEGVQGLRYLAQDGKLDWHTLYVELDDMVWNLLEWQKQNAVALSGGIINETDNTINLIRQVETTIVQHMATIIAKYQSLLEDESEDGVAFQEMETGDDIKGPANTKEDKSHTIYSIMDLLQQIVKAGASSHNTLLQIYEIAVSVAEKVPPINLRCKAFDMMAYLIQQGIVTSAVIDERLKKLKLESAVHIGLAEERHRSNAVLRARNRLDEQSEQHHNTAIFDVPERGVDMALQDLDVDCERHRSVTRTNATSFLAIPQTNTSELESWRVFLSAISDELHSDNQRDEVPADDLGMLTCGCIMSERYVEQKLQYTNICPSCGYPTEFKKPLDNLRRITKMIADKRAELGIAVEIDTQSNFISSPDGDIDGQENGISSDDQIDSRRPSIDSPGEPAVTTPAHMVFGSPGQGGGFPKEMLWENPNVKYTPEALEKLFGNQVHNRRVINNTTPVIEGQRPEGYVKEDPPFLPRELSSSARQLITNLFSRTSSDSDRLSRKSSLRESQNTLSPAQLARKPTHQQNMRPMLITQMPQNQFTIGGQPMSPMSRRTPGTSSIPIYPLRTSSEMTRSVSPSRYDPSSPHSSRFAPSSQRSGNFYEPTSPSIATSLQSFGSQSSRSNISPNQTREVRKRQPSYPDPAAPASSYGSSHSTLRSAATFQVDDDSASGSSMDYRSKIIRNPNQNTSVEGVTPRRPMNPDEERRHSSYGKFFPFYKAEYVHHVQTGGRLNFKDIIATSIAPNCSKFVLLEKKKFKVYSILASEKEPELLCCGKTSGEYGSSADPYKQISPEDKVTGRSVRWEYLMAELSNRFLAIAGTHGTLKVHDINQDGQPIYSYISELYDIRCMAISNDGQTIAVGVITSEYGREISQIIFHHIDPNSHPGSRQREPTKVTLPYPDPTGTMSFSDDSTYLTCSTLREPRFLVYDLAVPNQSPKLVMKSSRKLDISHDAEGITSVKFFPGNRWLCVTSVATGAPPIVVDSNIGVVDSNGGNVPVQLLTRLNKVGDKVHSCCVSPTGQALCMLDRSGNILVVYFPSRDLISDDGRRPRIVKVAKVQGAIKMSEAASIQFSPDGHRLVVVDRKADITIVDFAEADESKMTRSSAWE